LKALVARVQPDVVHAMRIPYEGMVSAMAVNEIPLIVSVWGNDFTLHAPATPLMARYTRLAMQRTTALHTDCRRDQRLARSWGFSARKPAMVLPGGGGVRTDVFFPAGKGTANGAGGRPDEPGIINPRGFRPYVRNDSFFQAIPLVLDRLPNTRFFCPGMGVAPLAGQAQRWVDRLGITASVELLPKLSQPELAEYFRCSLVTVSPSFHDGTPNTLLEAMACGSFPVAGDLESIREWITPGVNGLLVDPADPQALADAILLALANPRLITRAQPENLRLVSERAEYSQVMQEAEAFYRNIHS
jgi:glycosyltransferase involved in cell wall biosynthesis